ncbi:MAG TPA: MFS transporter [Allosphingosinicella sp.]|nr:MFS transporter [Allosphingosinicella sp.]
MQDSIHLLSKRRFLPLFVTQFLGAFNDNLYKSAMVILVTYAIYSDPTKEATFNAVAGALFILPFFLFSALAGQLADGGDKARIIRIVKTAEIAIMVAGAIGLLIHSIPLLLAGLFAMGVHSSFFGPIKYAILPQHLRGDEVLAGTGLVEAGTYIAILLGTIAGGLLGAEHVQYAAAGVLVVAALGWFAGRQVPPAPPEPDAPPAKMDWHIVRASIGLVNATLHIPRLFLAIVAISFFWMMGAILAAQFPPLVKNVLHADEQVATLFLAIFSVGVGLGSVLINRLLKGRVAAVYSPASALAMGAFIIHLYWNVRQWPVPLGGLMDLSTFVLIPRAEWVMVDLFGVAVSGGMFVVPLYAFLTTTVPKSETARTVAANNIVNSGAMVLAALVLTGLVLLGVSVAETLLMVAVSSAGAAWLAWKLHKACD